MIASLMWVVALGLIIILKDIIDGDFGGPSGTATA
jgi:hypothetical protein